MIKKHSFLMIAFLMFSIGLQGQWMQRNYIKRTLKIHSDTSVVIFEIIEEELNLNPDADYTYYWYTNRKIMSNKGGIGGYVLDGPYTRYNRKDFLMEQGAFRKGLKCGEWKHWDDKGNLMRTEPFKKGLLNGKVAVYGNGVVTQTLTYKKGIQSKGISLFKSKNAESVEFENPKIEVHDSVPEPTALPDSVPIEQPVKKKRFWAKKSASKSTGTQQDQNLPSNEN